MSTVPSSFVPRYVPYADGGIVSFSTSSRSAAMCSRASRKRGRKLLVLGHGLGELTLGLEESFLERPDALGRVLEPPSQDDDLFLEALDHLLELIDLSFVLGQSPLVLGSH